MNAVHETFAMGIWTPTKAHGVPARRQALDRPAGQPLHRYAAALKAGPSVAIATVRDASGQLRTANGILPGHPRGRLGQPDRIWQSGSPSAPTGTPPTYSVTVARSERNPQAVQDLPLVNSEVDHDSQQMCAQVELRVGADWSHRGNRHDGRLQLEPAPALGSCFKRGSGNA
jgi:hypothetical protein